MEVGQRILTLEDEAAVRRGPRSKLGRIARFGWLLAASWCVMTLSHECGHLLGGWASGGELVEFELRPWRLPHSLFRPDPNPLVTLWSGPLLGVIVPLLMALLIRQRWAFFVADFCLLANGSYMALGWLAGDRLLDATRLLDEGASPFLLAAYSLATIPSGYVRFRRDCISVLGNVPV